MPLATGTRLGSYEIAAPLGAGGMGEVYRATDTKLKRQVALKVLPTALSNDPNRLARFQREAEVLASLNHSNIAHIHGIEDSGDIRAIVMELVEGETLSDIIKRGPIPVDTAIAYAKQIASAFEYAHDRPKPVIHRDLKPANVQVTPEGVVKVLDFGLAKAMADEPSASVSDPVNSPTVTMGQTVAGVILGTAAYMSPEQAKGKPLDRRTDIWSFGVMLYEMVTGKRLFTGDDVGEVLAGVIKDDPKLDAVPARLRPAIERRIRKDPRKRWYSMEDVRFALDENPAQIDAAEAAPQRNLPWLIATAVLATIAMGLAFVHFREKPPEVRAINTALLPPENVEFDYAVAPYALPAISPDGNYIVFGGRSKGGKSQLWVRRFDSTTAQPLPGTESAATPFWSADSRWVAFGQNTKLKKVDIQGGPPVPITDLPDTFRGGSWNSDGVILYGLGGANPIQRVAASGGAPVPATNSGGKSHRSPWFLPDGRHFLYVLQGAEDMPVLVGSLDEPGASGKVVTYAQSSVAYSQGHILYVRGRTLMAQPFDASRLETTGEATTLEEGVPVFSPTSRLGAFAVSPSGMLVFSSEARASRSRALWKDRQGKLIGELENPEGYLGSLDLSPDGKSALVDINNGQDDLWIYDILRGIRTRFTFDPKTDRGGPWSPDGNTIYFHSNRQGPYDLYRKPANGVGTEELLFADSRAKNVNSISPDGKLLMFTRQDKNTLSDLWLLPLTGAAKAEPRLFLQTAFNEGEGVFSPDGGWAAYTSDESGTQQVYATPFPGPGGKLQISMGAGKNPRWRKDGKEIFYVTLEGQLMSAEVSIRGGVLEVGKVEKLFDGIVTDRGRNYDVSADGKRFLVADDRLSGPRPLTLLQNWTAALRK